MLRIQFITITKGVVSDNMLLLAPVLTRAALAMQVSTVATTMTLAEQNHAEELKRVCLEFVSKNLSAVMVSEGYQYMVTSCPSLQVPSCP